MQVFLLVMWIGAAIACAVIAKERGRSAGGWFVLGALFGIFALAVVAMLGRVPNLHNYESGSSSLLSGMSDTKKCVFCAEQVKYEAVKCKHCGSDLPKGSKPEPWYQEEKARPDGLVRPTHPHRVNKYLD